MFFKDSVVLNRLSALIVTSLTKAELVTENLGDTCVSASNISKQATGMLEDNVIAYREIQSIDLKAAKAAALKSRKPKA